MDASLPLPRRLSSALEAAWARGWATRPRLDPAVILGHAARRAGARPAEGPWLDRLDTLCASLRGEAQLSSLGLTIAYGQLVRIAASRARAERLWRRHPGILDRPLPPLIAIVGQMRSGTTRVHRLLAHDHRFAFTRLVDTLEPVPSGAVDLRAARARFGLAFLSRCNPALATIHPTGPADPEEEFGLHAFSLWGAQFEGQWFIPAFARACEAASAPDVQEEFGRLVKTIGWVRGIPADRPWLVKAPQFAQDLPDLAAAFPGIALIRLTRDPVAVVGSGASLAWHQARVQSDVADPYAIGAEWLRKTCLREVRMAAFFDRHPPAVTLDYDEVSADWRAAMAKVYAALGLQMTAAVEGRMEEFLVRAHAHQGHAYDLAAFGMDERSVAAALA